MARVLTFSRQFPAYHPRKGEPTYFVEKIWKSVWDSHNGSSNPLAGYWEQYDEVFPCKYKTGENIHVHTPKRHTIRALGKHTWKAGDMFSPRIWSAKPYYSPQIIIGPDMEAKKVWDIEIANGEVVIGNRLGFPYTPLSNDLQTLAKNDGLTAIGLMQWFNKIPFRGQIICWDESINY